MQSIRRLYVAKKDAFAHEESERLKQPKANSCYLQYSEDALLCNHLQRQYLSSF